MYGILAGPNSDNENLAGLPVVHIRAKFNNYYMTSFAGTSCASACMYVPYDTHSSTAQCVQVTLTCIPLIPL